MSEGERETYGLREVTQSPFPDLPQPESGDVFIRTEDLSCKRKGNLIFHHLSLSVCAGQVTAVTGRNGRGKPVWRWRCPACGKSAAAVC